MEQLLSNKIVYHIIVIILAALAAFIPRYLPVLFFSTRKIPEWFNEWMKYVPVSLFATLVVKGIFLTSSYHFTLFGYPERIIAALIVIVIAYFTRSMSISVIAGLVAVWLLSLAL